jgi:4-hydroxy-tetrahydrodipicolinate synthase
VCWIGLTACDSAAYISQMNHSPRSMKGVCAIAPTPFAADGRLDLDSLDRLTDFYAGCGCSGITVLGIMGEAQKLEPAEAAEVVHRVLRRTASLSVIVGISAPGLAAMRSLSRIAMDAGAAAVMIAPHSGLRTDDQIVDYFSQVCEAIGPETPWVLQDYPQALSVHLSVSVIQRIVTAQAGCVMLKHEDWPGLEKISALRRLEREGSLRPVSILTGNGGLFLDFEMERGADGAMTGYSFPEMLVDVVRLSASQERAVAHDLFDAHLPLLRYEQQQGVGLAVRKYVLHRRGLLVSDAQRTPRPSLSAAGRGEVDFLLKRLSRFDSRAAI